jgi:hypothetical protein
MPLPDGAKVHDFQDVLSLQRRVNTFQAIALTKGIYSQALALMNDLIEVDQEPGGLRGSARFEELIVRMMETGKAFGRAQEVIAAQPIEMNPAAGMEYNLVKIGMSILGETEHTWDRKGIPAGQSSPGAKEAAELRKELEELLSSLKGTDELVFPQDGKQPLITFAVPLSEAHKLVRQGLLSISSKDFIIAPLPQKGPDFIRMGLNPIANPTEQNWRSYLYIIAGATEIDGKFYKADISYPTGSVYVRISDNNLLKVEQVGAQLRFSKNSSGYAEAGGEASVLGFGGGVDFSLSNIYASISYLEALAYLDGDWQKIRDGVLEQQRSGLSTIDPKLIERTLAPLATDRLTDAAPSDLESFAIVSYDGKARVLAPKNPVPVYIRLQDSTLLRIEAPQENARFYRTSSGYAVAGAKVNTPVATAGGEVPISHQWTEITPTEALGYFDNDWRPIFQAVAKQARIIPDSVWPSTVLKTIYPNAPQPKLRVHSFKEPAPYLGE